MQTPPLALVRKIKRIRKQLWVPSPRSAAGLLAVLALLAAFAPMATVRGTTTAGVTEALVNVGQLTRDASSAILVVGFSMTSTNPADALDQVTVVFGGVGFNPGDDNDLRALDVDSRVSGVALYRDTGSADDALDAGDVPVVFDNIGWTGITVTIDLTGHAETLPAAVAGRYHWILAIRTSDTPGTLFTGDQITATIPIAGIRATDLDTAGFVSQPPLEPVTTSALTVRLTRTFDLLGGADQWIGPATATVNAMAVLGLRIVDGGITTNRGIQDSIAGLLLTLRERAGAVSSIDFLSIGSDGSTSGIAFYLDTGTVQDEWDAADAPVTLASITPTVFPPGGVAFAVTFPAPGLDVPDANAGAFDIFVVVRSDAIETGDAFNLQIEAQDIAVRGLLASQGGTVDADLATPLPFGVIPSSRVLGDNTPPRLRNLQWTEASAYLGALGLDLYFVNTMPATQFADVTGQARDDESGLLGASFSAEPSLASSPGPVALFGAGAWRAWSGTYGFAAASTDASSPVVVTVTDQVGNAITTDAVRSNFRYIQTTQAILIQPNPGWIPPGGPFWVDPAGKLWFSNLIQGTATITLRVDIISLFGGGLANVSASAEPSLAGGPFPAFRDFPPGVDAATHAVDYEVAANSTGASSPARITAFDNSGNSVTADFEYGLDTEGPVITIDYPTTGAALTGTFTVRATVRDALTAVDRVELEVDPFGGFQRMFFDGTAYFLPISSALWPDGPHRLIVRATDMVDNAHAVGVDAVFGNAAADTTAPTAAFVAPAAGELVSGVLVFRVSAADAGGVQAVELTVFGQTVPMVFNAAAGYWEYAFDSRSIADNRYTATVVVTDEAGLQTTATVSFAVQNGNVWGSLLDATPLLLLLFLIVAFVLVVWMMRRGLWGAARRKEKGPPPPEG